MALASKGIEEWEELKEGKDNQFPECKFPLCL